MVYSYRGSLWPGQRSYIDRYQEGNTEFDPAYPRRDSEYFRKERDNRPPLGHGEWRTPRPWNANPIIDRQPLQYELEDPGIFGPWTPSQRVSLSPTDEVLPPDEAQQDISSLGSIFGPGPPSIEPYQSSADRAEAAAAAAAQDTVMAQNDPMRELARIKERIRSGEFRDNPDVGRQLLQEANDRLRQSIEPAPSPKPPTYVPPDAAERLRERREQELAAQPPARQAEWPSLEKRREYERANMRSPQMQDMVDQGATPQDLIMPPQGPPNPLANIRGPNPNVGDPIPPPPLQRAPNPFPGDPYTPPTPPGAGQPPLDIQPFNPPGSFGAERERQAREAGERDARRNPPTPTPYNPLPAPGAGTGTAPPNPFAGLGDAFGPPSQEQIDQFAGGAGAVAPAPGQVQGPPTMPAGPPGLPRPRPDGPADPFGPRVPQARPPQPGDPVEARPSNVPPAQFADLQNGPRDITPGIRSYSGQESRLPSPRPSQGMQDVNNTLDQALEEAAGILPESPASRYPGERVESGLATAAEEQDGPRDPFAPVGPAGVVPTGLQLDANRWPSAPLETTFDASRGAGFPGQETLSPVVREGGMFGPYESLGTHGKPEDDEEEAEAPDVPDPSPYGSESDTEAATSDEGGSADSDGYNDPYPEEPEPEEPPPAPASYNVGGAGPTYAVRRNAPTSNSGRMTTIYGNADRYPNAHRFGQDDLVDDMIYERAAHRGFGALTGGPADTRVHKYGSGAGKIIGGVAGAALGSSGGPIGTLLGGLAGYNIGRKVGGLAQPISGFFDPNHPERYARPGRHGGIFRGDNIPAMAGAAAGFAGGWFTPAGGIVGGIAGYKAGQALGSWLKNQGYGPKHNPFAREDAPETMPTPLGDINAAVFDKAMEISDTSTHDSMADSDGGSNYDGGYSGGNYGGGYYGPGGLTEGVGGAYKNR